MRTFGVFFFFLCDFKGVFPPICVLCQICLQLGQNSVLALKWIHLSSELFSPSVYGQRTAQLWVFFFPPWFLWFSFPPQPSPGSFLWAQPCPSTHQSLLQCQNHSPLPVTSCQRMFFIKQTPTSIRLNKTRFIRHKQRKTERKSK